jgi:hypothetical protein
MVRQRAIWRHELCHAALEPAVGGERQWDDTRHTAEESKAILNSEKA